MAVEDPFTFIVVPTSLTTGVAEQLIKAFHQHTNPKLNPMWEVLNKYPEVSLEIYNGIARRQLPFKPIQEVMDTFLGTFAITNNRVAANTETTVAFPHLKASTRERYVRTGLHAMEIATRLVLGKMDPSILPPIQEVKNQYTPQDKRRVPSKYTPEQPESVYETVEELYIEYHDRLVHLASTIVGDEAPDIVQNVFIRVMEGQRAGKIRNKSWLYTATYGAALKELKRLRRLSSYNDKVGYS